MSQIYFASPLFSEMELNYNAQLVKQIREKYTESTVFLPQEQCDINDKQSYADSMMIAKADTEAVLKSDLVVAILDGLVIDPGVASEIGVAYQAGIPVIGLHSDQRHQGADNQEKLDALQNVAESQFPYVNLYTVGLIKLNGEIVNTSQELIERISNYI